MTILYIICTLTMSVTFSIAQWNCRSIKSNGPEYIWHLSRQKYTPDIICLQETWIYKENDYPNINGYVLADYSARDNTKGGGTAIYVKHNISYTRKKIESHFEISCIEFKHENSHVTLVNLYDPQKNTKCEHYAELFDQIHNKFVILGDFNAHHPYWGGKQTDTKGLELFNCVENRNVVLLNDGTGTRCNPCNLELSPIDLSFCSPNMASKINWSVDLSSSYGSDHHVVTLSINYTPEVSNNVPDYIWNLQKANWDGFARKCDEILIHDMVSDNVDETCARITDCIVKTAGEFVPVKNRNRKNKKPAVPWWTAECTNSVKKRNKARNRAQHTGKGEDFENYKHLEKECRVAIKNAQNEYWESYCNSLNCDTTLGSLWYNIKKMMGKASKSLSLPTLLYDNKQYETIQEKADLLVHNYAKVSSNVNYSKKFTADKKHIEDKEYEKLLQYYKDNSASYNEPFTLQELKDAIADTNDSSPGKDRVAYSMFKQFSNKSLSVILLFMNRIWFLQKLPCQWKHSVIIPSFKTGKDPSDPQSYRPIALTSNFVKIMEKMVNNRLRWFLEKNNLYNPNQSGFRKNRNTMEQIIRLDNDIHKAFIKKHFTVGVFIDFQKAFDMLWKHGLLMKMVSLGIRGNLLGWVNSFLTDRTIQVKINSTYSEILVIQNGTPQGSCISPTLFNIMVNDLSDCIKHSAMSQFADDGAIWLSGKNLKYMQNKIQSD